MCAAIGIRLRICPDNIDDAVHAARNSYECVGTPLPSSSSTTQRQVPGARNGLWASQSANPDFIAAIDSNRRDSFIRFATLTVIHDTPTALVQLTRDDHGDDLRFYNLRTTRRNFGARCRMSINRTTRQMSTDGATKPELWGLDFCIRIVHRCAIV